MLEERQQARARVQRGVRVAQPRVAHAGAARGVEDVEALVGGAQLPLGVLSRAREVGEGRAEQEAGAGRAVREREQAPLVARRRQVVEEASSTQIKPIMSAMTSTAVNACSGLLPKSRESRGGQGRARGRRARPACGAPAARACALLRGTRAHTRLTADKPRSDSQK